MRCLNCGRPLKSFVIVGSEATIGIGIEKTDSDTDTRPQESEIELP
jgi:hypothetical protein